MLHLYIRLAILRMVNKKENKFFGAGCDSLPAVIVRDCAFAH